MNSKPQRQRVITVLQLTFGNYKCKILHTGGIWTRTVHFPAKMKKENAYTYQRLQY